MPRKTHDLSMLLNKCINIDETFRELEWECARLTIYGVQPRYPFEIDIEESDMKIALKDADDVYIFIFEKLQLKK